MPTSDREALLQSEGLWKLAYGAAAYLGVEVGSAIVTGYTELNTTDLIAIIAGVVAYKRATFPSQPGQQR